MADSTEKKGIDAILKKPWVAGAVIGLGAALVQWLFYLGAQGKGPVAYGFCVACHSRDLIDAVINDIFGTTLFVAPLSKAAAISPTAYIPVLTIIGVIVGALIAALVYREFRIKKGSVGSCIKYGLGGFFFMICALLMGACPYRIALRIGYGDIVALIGLVAIVVGVFIGVKIALKKMGGK